MSVATMWDVSSVREVLDEDYCSGFANVNEDESRRRAIKHRICRFILQLGCILN
jgi:hypothetical protein